MQEMRPGKPVGKAAPIRLFLAERDAEATSAGSAFGQHQLRLVKDNGFISVDEHAILEVPANGLGEHDFLQITAAANEIIHALTVGPAE